MNKHKALYPGRHTDAELDQDPGKARTLDVNLKLWDECALVFHRFGINKVQELVGAHATRRGQLVSEIPGFGDLNAVHLSLLLTHVGLQTNHVSAGENELRGSSWIVPDADSHSDASAVVQAAAARLNLLLKSYCTGGCKLSPGEAQAALCIYIYACQTYLTGSNAGHPRDRFGVVKATSIGILAQLKKKAKI